MGLGQQRGATSGDDAYLYEGNKTGVKWDDLHAAFASSALPTACLLFCTYTHNCCSLL